MGGSGPQSVNLGLRQMYGEEIRGIKPSLLKKALRGLGMKFKIGTTNEEVVDVAFRNTHKLVGPLGLR